MGLRDVNVYVLLIVCFPRIEAHVTSTTSLRAYLRCVGRHERRLVYNQVTTHLFAVS